MIKLNKDNSYELQWKYMGKRVKEVNNKGKFSWDITGSNILLDSVQDIPSMYKVGEHKLIQVDQGGRIIIASNQLLKDSTSILEQYWKLTEVKGKAVSVAPGEGKEPHMILKVLDSRVNGNGGCNGYGGTYTLGAGNKIHFSPIISTKMACNALSVENAFFGVFQSVDQYKVNGDSLVLLHVNKRQLARFVEEKQE